MSDDKTDEIPMAECGSCRAIIPLDSNECPECGIQISGISDEPLGECGACKALVSLDSKSCPECGVYFVADDVVDVLRQWFNDTGIDVNTLFSKMDSDGDGSIDPEELKNGLLKLNLADLPPSQIDRLISEFDTDSDGLISLGELVFTITGQSLTEEPIDSSDSNAKEYSDNVLNRVMKKFGITDKELFLIHAADYDANDNGYLTEPELKTAAEAFADDKDSSEESKKVEQSEDKSDADDELTENDAEVVSEEDSDVTQSNDDEAEDLVEGEDIDEVVDEEQEIVEVDITQTPMYKFGLAAAENNMTIRDIFESMDSDDDGKIDGPELQKGIEDISGDKLSPKEVIELMSIFDDDSDGRLDPMELIKAIESLDLDISSDNSDSSPKDPVMALVDAMDEAGSNPASIFRELDRNGDKMINIDELRQRVDEVLNESLSDEEINQLFDRLDVDGDGLVDMVEFIETIEEADEDHYDEDTSLSSKKVFPSKLQSRMMSKKWNDVFWPIIHAGLFIFVVMWVVNATLAPFVDGSGGIVELESDLGLYSEDGVTYFNGDMYPCDDSTQTGGCKNSLTPFSGENGEISMPSGFYLDGILFIIIGTIGFFASLFTHLSIVPGWRARARAIKESEGDRKEVKESLSDEDFEDAENDVSDEAGSEEIVETDSDSEEPEEASDEELDDDEIDIGSHIGLVLDDEEVFGVIIEFDDDEGLVTIEEDGTGDLVTGYQDDMFLED